MNASFRPPTLTPTLTPTRTRARALACVCAGVFLLAAVHCPSAEPPPAPVTLETAAFRLRLAPESGQVEVLDLRAGVTWGAHGRTSRFGEATLVVDGKPRRFALGKCHARVEGRLLRAAFQPDPERPNLSLIVELEAVEDGTALECRYTAAPGLRVDGLRLLEGVLQADRAGQGYAVVPVREGLLIPAGSVPNFSHRFDTYAYEGCHLAMFGMVQGGAALLATWSDPNVAVDLRGSATNGAGPFLAGSLQLRQSATAFRLHVLGPGDYHVLAGAYRTVAEKRGWRVPWDRKLEGHPGRARLFGASNFKLWSLLDRRMNDESTREESVRVNWTFAEASDVAAHLKNDLGLDRVLFLMGGWIHRGYDNQHPDILPAAPECGGDAGLAESARRIRGLGYVVGLHDNYQDIYRDSPSWNEDLVMKTADGRLAKGGQWAGGRAYLTCSRTALDLARRPRNLPAVRHLTGADAYFIDTTYAAGLQECFDPRHPLTRADDLKWKQALSDYARDLFGIFGSECGREWALPHADFFEGLTGVSGRLYHDADLQRKTGGVGIPFFELVYRDTIALYGKYGYDPERAAEYVLHHVLLGRPLHYHAVPPHRYWLDPAGETETLAVRPSVGTIEFTAPRQVRVAYRWQVDRTPAADWRVFVHFTDAADRIRFQNDHEPPVATSRWQPGRVDVGPLTVQVPPGLSGTFSIRVGLFRPDGGRRALFDGADPEERSRVVGRLVVTDDTIGFEPESRSQETPPAPHLDPGVFARAEQGWAADGHPFDRFLKNTHEILSPLHETTARSLMTRHEFLSPDRKVQRSVFGSGPDSTAVVVNAGGQDYRFRDRTGAEVVLPPYGFLVEGPSFVAFHARAWNGLSYDRPVLFTLRSLDGRAWPESGRLRVFHGFGDARLALRGRIVSVPRETVLEP